MFCDRKLNYIGSDEATLREHIALLAGASSSDRILYLVRKPWFIAIAGVFAWIVFVAIITVVWWRWRRSRGKAAGLFSKLIKIILLDYSTLFTCSFWKAKKSGIAFSGYFQNDEYLWINMGEQNRFSK